MLRRLRALTEIIHFLSLQVMALGGMAAVSASEGWLELADKLQHNPSLANLVCSVYDCYLHPVEADLPPGFRPARVLDFMEGRVKQRAAMGGRLGSYAGVLHAVQQVEQALQLIAKLRLEPCQQQEPAVVQLQQEQEQREPKQEQQQGAMEQQQQQQQLGVQTVGTQKEELVLANGGVGGELQVGAVPGEGRRKQPAVIPPPAAAAVEAMGMPSQCVPAVVQAALQLLRAAAVGPVDVIADAQGWGWRPDFCPERAAVCKREFARRGGRRKQEMEEESGEDAGKEQSGSRGIVGHGPDLVEDGGDGVQGVKAGEGEREQLGAAGSHSREKEQEGHFEGSLVEGEHGSEFSSKGGVDESGPGGKGPPGSVATIEGVMVEGLAGAFNSGVAAAASGAVAEGGAYPGDMGAKRCRLKEAEEAADAVEGANAIKRLKGSSEQVVVLEQEVEEAVGELQGAESGHQQPEEGQAQQQRQHSVQAVVSDGVNEQEQQGLQAGRGSEDGLQQAQEQSADAPEEFTHKQGKQKGAAHVHEDVWHTLPTEAVLKHGARWMLLSLRAVRAGPPGCTKALPLIASFHLHVAAFSARDFQLAASQKAGSDGGKSAKRVFKGLTPKCGVCITCRNPQMKKACQTNRERLAQGLHPIFGASDGKEVKVEGSKSAEGSEIGGV